jgi:SAM-dependent methyltransferase
MDLDTPNATALTEDFEFAALEHAVRYRAALIDEFRPYLTGNVVEVGAGIGQLTTELARVPAVTRLLAVEPDAGFAAAFRAAHPTREFLHGTAGAIAAGQPWHAVVSVNVLEHIRDDDAELRVWRELLAPQQGHLCVFVPARPELYAPIDKDFGHFRRYTKPQLAQKLRDAGFVVERLHYFNLVGYFAWWASFKMLGRRAFDPTSVKFFDRAIFPWSHAFERTLVRPPFGQSLLAVARATSSRGRAD